MTGRKKVLLQNEERKGGNRSLAADRRLPLSNFR